MQTAFYKLFAAFSNVKISEIVMHPQLKAYLSLFSNIFSFLVMIQLINFY